MSFRKFEGKAASTTEPHFVLLLDPMNAGHREPAACQMLTTMTTATMVMNIPTRVAVSVFAASASKAVIDISQLQAQSR
jgi:hypothetical protein